MMGERPAGSTGLQRLDERVLRKGDIVLVTARAAVSAAIRMATRSDVSHAMVCVEDRSVIDATDEGVHSRNTQRHFLDARCPVYVLRLKGGLASAQLEAVTDFLRGAIATRYSVPQAMLAGVGGLGVPASKQQFCSRLVAQAFASAGIDLVADPDFCSPADLRSSALLEVVPNATVAVNEAEVEFWSSREDIPQLMRDVTNALLAGARSIDPGIESPDDIATFLRGHPERDDDMSRILEASGYLTLWERERAKNPWQYEPGLMALESEVAMRSYCASVLANEGPGPNRYVRNRATYAWLAAHFGLRYFALMQELHETLADLHRQRIETAKAWSRKRGIAVDGPRPHLEPHTAAWFAALEEWDPPQALMARTITQAAGRVDVCSVCGDDPANDYRLAEEFRPPAGVDTWRLCDDCAASRLDAGEPITPVA